MSTAIMIERHGRGVRAVGRVRPSARAAKRISRVLSADLAKLRRSAAKGGLFSPKLNGYPRRVFVGAGVPGTNFLRRFAWVKAGRDTERCVEIEPEYLLPFPRTEQQKARHVEKAKRLGRKHGYAVVVVEHVLHGTGLGE